MHVLDRDVDYGTARHHEQAYMEKHDTRTGEIGKPISAENRGNKVYSFDHDSKTRSKARQDYLEKKYSEKNGQTEENQYDLPLRNVLMGWFDAPGHEGVTLGDDVLDETYAFLKKLSGMYESALGRKISCEELRVLLETSLSANADDKLFANFEEQKVSAVQIKTAKRPRRQTYKVGDLFVIPLSHEQFAFGRIMQMGGSMGTLVEVFKATSQSATPTPRITQAGRLFHPVYLNGLRAFRDLAFPIVSSDPEYSPDDLESLRFRSGIAGNYEVSQGTSKPRPVSDAEARDVEPVSLWEPESLAKRVAMALLRK